MMPGQIMETDMQYLLMIYRNDPAVRRFLQARRASLRN
jgi:hypothetical protein